MIQGYEQEEEILYKKSYQAKVSPAAYAQTTTKGTGDEWRLYDHLKFLDDILLFLDARWIRRLMIFFPPQHGKSELTSRNFPAWYLGNHPNDRFLLGSYEADFAASWGRKARESMKEFGLEVFGLKLDPKRSAAKDWNIYKHSGGMQTAGRDGAFSGKKGDAVGIDDPIKNRAEAKSPTIQETVYDFYTDAADTRLSKKGIMYIIQTRWDLLDLSGRILKAEDSYNLQEALNLLYKGETIEDEWVVFKLPAIALENERYTYGKEILWERAKGEALCPDLHPLKQLLAKKKRTPLKKWVSLYDQNPIEDTGEFFEEDWFKVKHKEHLPKRGELIRLMRWWDLAKTKKKKAAAKKSGKAARTAGVLIGVTRDHDLWILNSKVYQEKPGTVRKKILNTAISDNQIWKERYKRQVLIRGGLDPGQASGDQELTYSKILIGHNFKLIREDASKEERADNVAEFAEINNIYILDDGKWDHKDFIKEHLQFPEGEFKDQVDATSGAFGQMIDLLYEPAFKGDPRSIRSRI